MSRDIQIEILSPCVLPGEEFSVALVDGAENAIIRYSIVDSRTYAIIVQSGETEETVWETIVPAAGHYYIRVEAAFGDGSLVKVIEPLSVCQL
jgi:hypothetical protein